MTVTEKFSSYPRAIRDRMLLLREVVFDVAREVELGEVQETLKWGESAYLSAHGSTVRMDWKPAKPEQIGVYFNCKTKLVDTFRMIYRDVLMLEGNRAVPLPVSGELPVNELRHCFALSLNYHRVKHLPLLSA